MRILIAEDQDLVRETIAAFLQAEGLGDVFTAASLSDALRQLALAQAFDLVVLDYQMPDMNGFEGLERVLQAAPGKPVAILSAITSREVAEAANRAGATGFLPKTMGARALVTALRLIAAGKIFMPFSTLQADAEIGPFNLTRREIEMLRGICEGKSNKEIARDYVLQEVTVKLHVSTLTRKLGARNRTHAAMIARDHKLV